MHVLISVINLKSIKARAIISGKPRILMYKGRIDEQALKKERYTINELQEKLRSKDIFSLGDVEYAILETNGDITVVPKPNRKALTPEDLGLEGEYSGISYDLVIDGKVMQKNLKQLGKSEMWLSEKLEELDINQNEILIATVDGKDEIYCQKKKKRK